MNKQHQCKSEAGHVAALFELMPLPILGARLWGTIAPSLTPPQGRIYQGTGAPTTEEQ